MDLRLQRKTVHLPYLAAGIKTLSFVSQSSRGSGFVWAVI